MKFLCEEKPLSNKRTGLFQMLTHWRQEITCKSKLAMTDY